MNTRQLMQGLAPTPEFHRQHTYVSYRQFPELQKSKNQIESESNRDFHPNKSITRTIQLPSFHKLDELRKSANDDLTAIRDFRKILLENRRKLNSSNHHASSSASITSSKVSISSTTNEVSSIDCLNLANEKLTKISVSFDSQASNSHLAGFSGAKLTKVEFNTLLRRCLNINLKKMELDVLFDRMDGDCSGLIDGVEFIRYFFALGKEARDHIMQETMEAKYKRLEESRRLAMEEEQRIQEWQDSQITNFTPEDTESALRKLEEAAFRWDPGDQIESKYVKGFEAFLSPYEFKVQIDTSFGIKLTGAETGALIQMFSTREGRHPVDGQMFIKKFHALHQKTKKADVSLQKRLKRRRQRVLDMGQQVDYMPQMLGR